MRFRLREGERSTKYSPGQFVSQAYAERYGHKVKQVRKRKGATPKPPEIPLPPEDYGDEFEITVTYGEEA